MITISATIRWNGTHLVCQYENGHRESMPWDSAIDAHTDSHMIASQFGDAVSVNHDRETVHVEYEVAAEDYESDKVESMHTLEAMASGSPYVLESDAQEKGLTDDQIARAIRAAKNCEGEQIIVSDGRIERYVEIDEITIPVLGCRK